MYVVKDNLPLLYIQVLRSSPSPAFRAVWSLAQNHFPLARDLFNAAFVSCWTELSEVHQDELIQSLEEALTIADLPEITQVGARDEMRANWDAFIVRCDYAVRSGVLELYLQVGLSVFLSELIHTDAYDTAS